jgi:hypothetical protein
LVDGGECYDYRNAEDLKVAVAVVIFVEDFVAVVIFVEDFVAVLTVVDDSGFVHFSVVDFVVVGAAVSRVSIVADSELVILAMVEEPSQWLVVCFDFAVRSLDSTVTAKVVMTAMLM